MLARIANNLFWMGRYLERVEHTARFVKVNYFSALDTPGIISREEALQKIAQFNNLKIGKKFYEEDILFKVGFDEKNPNSIFNQITWARENARGARDIISTELWESINRYYHFGRNYDIEAYKRTHLHDFTQTILELTAIIKGKIENTLIHNETWHAINLGQLIEKAIQIFRAISLRLPEIGKSQDDNKSNVILLHQLATLLRGLEAFDMSRKFYRSAPNLSNTMEFLLMNPDFPRSIFRCLHNMRYHLRQMSREFRPLRGSVEFRVNKLYTKIQYQEIDEVLENLNQNIHDLLMEHFEIAREVEQEFFSV